MERAKHYIIVLLDLNKFIFDVTSFGDYLANTWHQHLIFLTQEIYYTRFVGVSY